MICGLKNKTCEQPLGFYAVNPDYDIKLLKE